MHLSGFELSQHDVALTHTITWKRSAVKYGYRENRNTNMDNHTTTSEDVSEKIVDTFRNDNTR